MSVAKFEPSGEHGPSPEDILQQMERVLASEEFHSPERGKRFLRFVITETLDGRSQFLKAFTIANEIFGRQSTFDAQNDPVVRIEAGRIRRGLERYYLVAGQFDPVVITIPKGGYVPHFEYAQGLHATDVTDHGLATSGLSLPSVASRRPAFITVAAAVSAVAVVTASLIFSITPKVFPPRESAISSSVTNHLEPIVIVDLFQSDDSESGATDVAQGLRDEVIGQLATFSDIMVIADPTRASYGSATSYNLVGSVQRDGDKLRAILRLVRRADSAVVWAKNYDADLRVRSILQIQADVGREIADAVAQPYGPVFSADANHATQLTLREDAEAYDCASAYYSYRKAMDVQSHTVARNCLQHATQLYPKDAKLWAFLSLVYLDEVHFRYKLGTTPAAGAGALAKYAAQRATSIAPNDPRVLQASMLVSFFNNDVETALKDGAAAYAQNSNDAEVAGEYGLRLAMSGKWQSGCELISRALNRSAGPKGYYEVGMALCAFMRGDLQAAELWSRMCDLDYNPMHRLVLLSILGAEGKTAEAAQERHWLNANATDLMKNIPREVSMRLQRKEDQERFLTGLRESGVVIASSSSGEMSSN